jgi:cation:H+ antiporter
MRVLLLILSVAATVPAFYVRFWGASASAPLRAAIFGVAVLGAALLLSWATEAAEHEISRALAMAALALVAILPEYAVDIYFTWTSAVHPAYREFALANMTGANRLLVGVGWPLVVLVHAGRRRRGIRIERPQRTEAAFLAAATVYAAVIPLKGSLTLVDSLVLLVIFALYVRSSAGDESDETALFGPAALIGGMGRWPRRTTILAIFAFAAAVVLVSAEPFADSLVATGRSLGWNEFLLVQWIAPLASEAPELVIALVWTLRWRPHAGFSALLSSKVNQWTLLVGSIPVAYSLRLGRMAVFPLEGRQVDEMWLTMAQSLLAVVLLLDDDLGIRESVLLLGLYAAQVFLPEIRMTESVVYAVLAVGILLVRRREAWPFLRSGLSARR